LECEAADTWNGPIAREHRDYIGGYILQNEWAVRCDDCVAVACFEETMQCNVSRYPVLISA